MRKLTDIGKRRRRGQPKAKSQASEKPKTNRRKRYEKLTFPQSYVGRPRKEDPVGVL